MTMRKTIKIPAISDDPITGLCLNPLPAGLFFDKVIIEHGALSYTSSKLSPVSINKTFSLKDVSKFLLLKKKVSFWGKGQKLDLFARNGTECALYLVEINGKKHELIPKFLVRTGQKQWNKFLIKLGETTGLSVEEIDELS